MNESIKPDLEEGTNVRTAHRDVDREAAASAREMSVRENGLEPISSLVIVALVLVALIAGGVFFKDTLLNYGETPAGYARGEDPAGGVKGPPLGEAYATYYAKGESLYSSNCASCHGGDGAGISAPPLQKSEWAQDKAHIMAIVRYGVDGKISVNGKDYDMGVMPNIGGDWDAFKLAALSTYVGNSFGNETGEITSLAQAEELLKRSKGRPAGPVNVTELTTGDRFKEPLKAASIDKKAIVNKKTGEPN